MVRLRSLVEVLPIGITGASLTAFGLALGLASYARGGDLGPESPRLCVLQPSETPPLRIDFNYSLDRALPAFAAEPQLPGKLLARGLIPTLPPTPFLRNVTDGELYLNTERTGDFVPGKYATHRSFYDGHRVFSGMRVFSALEDLEIPYAVELFADERFCAGWLHVNSGWEGGFEVDGRRWRLMVVDNLNAEIGKDDCLYLQRISDYGPGRLIPIRPVPGCLVVDGHTWNLAFEFKPDESGVIVEARFSETNLPMGDVTLDPRACSYICLSSESVTAVLDATAGPSAVPAGVYQVTGCLLNEIPGAQRHPAFVRCDRTVTIKPGETVALPIGQPLLNTVDVSRERNRLHLTYRLLGQAGEQYDFCDWRARPQFTIWKGPVRIGSGTAPFG